MSGTARTAAATDRQQTRAWAQSGQGAPDDTVVAIRPTLDDLNTRSQQALNRDSRRSAFEKRAKRRVVHAERVVRHVVVQRPA
jgi:hypothetical protein